MADETKLSPPGVKNSRFVFEPQPRPRKFLTVPNLMSIARMFLLIPLFIFLRKGASENGNFWALVIMCAALVSDMLDGLIARWFHVETDWGRVLDPIADKLWLGSLAVFLALPSRANPLPVEFLCLILLRDLMILAGSFYVYRRRGLVVTSNYLGKVTMFIVALTLIAYTVNWVPPAHDSLTPLTLVWIASGFVLLSGIHYLIRFVYYVRTST